MQPHALLLLLALTLAPTALAKSKQPFVNSYSSNDCTGQGANDKVKFPSGCVAFDPANDYVLVNFGTELDTVTAVSVFSDGDCKTSAGPAVTAPNPGTPAQCISMKDWKSGQKWGSVKTGL